MARMHMHATLLFICQVLLAVSSSTSFTVTSAATVAVEVDAAPAAAAAPPVTIEDIALHDSNVEQYLSSLNGDTAAFYVNGWRWHSMSFIRDAFRLESFARGLLRKTDIIDAAAEDGATLSRAADHVIDFNLAGLDKIEQDLWFLWLRDRLCRSQSGLRDDIRVQISCIIDSIVEERRQLTLLAREVRQQARLSALSSTPIADRQAAIRNVAAMSKTIGKRMKAVFDRCEKVIIPAVALTVSEREQRAIGSIALRQLGVLDSRRHLVGMHDAVWESRNIQEMELFEKEIPYLARQMLSRWKKKLYLPAADMLENCSSSKL